MSFTRTKVDADEEKRIITLMIVSNDFCKKIAPIIQPKWLASPLSQTVCQWIIQYYQDFGKSPEKKIKDVFDLRKGKLEDSEIKMIHEFLQVLNEEYPPNKESNLAESDSYNVNLNDDFYYDRAVQYIRKRAALVLSASIKELIGKDQIEKAEDAIQNFSKVVKSTSGMYNPHDPMEIEAHFQEGDKGQLIKFPGALGKLFGWWEREWFIIGQGPYGVGKSSFLQEIRMLAIRERLKVVDFNLEMSKKQFNRRHYKRILVSNDVAGKYLYPEFDCLWNQIGTCKKTIRTCNSKIRNGIGEPKPHFKDAPDAYISCRACRGTKDYYTETWFETVTKQGIDQYSVEDKINSIERNNQNCCRVKNYPRDTATYDDLSRDLDILEYTEDFIPDIILVDYVDIMASSYRNHNTDEEKINSVCLDLARLAKERHALVVTMSQVKTGVVEKGRSKHGKMGDASGSARGKYAHADFCFSLMQNNEEKEAMILRVNVVKNRDGSYNEMHEVIILQQMQLGIALIESEDKIVRFE
jgi:hypothetical protein